MVGTQLAFMYCPSAPSNRTMVYTDALSQAFYGSNWTVTLAAGDYAVDDGVDSGWMDRNNVPHPAGQDTRAAARQRRPAFASVTDGTSNTILVSEDAGRPDLYLDGRLIPSAPPSPGTRGQCGDANQRRLRGGLGRLQQRVLHRRRLQPNEHTNWSSNNEVYSFHPGGANHVFADGSVHFIKKSTAPSVFVALISPAGGEVISADGY